MSVVGEGESRERAHTTHSAECRGAILSRPLSKNTNGRRPPPWAPPPGPGLCLAGQGAKQPEASSQQQAQSASQQPGPGDGGEVPNTTGSVSSDLLMSCVSSVCRGCGATAVLGSFGRRLCGAAAHGWGVKPPSVNSSAMNRLVLNVLQPGSWYGAHEGPPPRSPVASDTDAFHCDSRVPVMGPNKVCPSPPPRSQTQTETQQEAALT